MYLEILENDEPVDNFFGSAEGYEEHIAMCGFQDWLAYQEKIATSYPQDSEQREAFEAIKRCAGVLA